MESQSGGSGGFDGDRATPTRLNGHSVATGDWFVLDQVSVSFANAAF